MDGKLLNSKLRSKKNSIMHTSFMSNNPIEALFTD